MTATEVHELLTGLGACFDAKTWAKGKDLHTIWTTCDRGDWLLWIAGKMADKDGWPTRKQLVLAACACAETALKYVRPGQDQPRKAIETARAWVRGEASIEDVRRSAYAAADAAAYAANAADAAAYAANAADAPDAVAVASAASAAYAASAAAAYDAAAYAASAAAAAAAYDAADARAKALANLANVVRQELPEPCVAKAVSA